MEPHGIERYLKYVDEQTIAEVLRAARPLYGLRLFQINSTFHGGGVAGMLRSLIPLLNDVGIEARWSLLYGDPALFQTTKKLHNALQGELVELSTSELESYLGVNEAFARYGPSPADYDVTVIHDPQPLPMIRYAGKRGPWIWRCHIDLSTPHQPVWDLLKPFILRYDGVVVSAESFRKPDLVVETALIPPAIDPFSPINRELTEEQVAKKLAEYHVPQDKPLLVQVSRFDKWKDPLGVLEVYRRVKREVDCRLVMLGNMASDDPEGPQIYAQVEKQAAELVDVHLISQTDELLVNALQRAATVVLQLSLREGFGLTVSEALWKGTPVVATQVGGIPLQVLDGETGFLVAPQDYQGMAERVLELLMDPGLRERLGQAGREHVRGRFLMTRLLLDWLVLLNKCV